MKQKPPSIKDLPIETLREVADLALKAYDAGLRPHIHTPHLLAEKIEAVREVRKAETSALRERQRY